MKECIVSECDRPSRALGRCDTHYRQLRSPGRPSMDRTVWKVRVRTKHGSQPYYFSTRAQAYARAQAAAEAGNLLFFAEYELKEEIT